jgi:hypothetical protein
MEGCVHIREESPVSELRIESQCEKPIQIERKNTDFFSGVRIVMGSTNLTVSSDIKIRIYHEIRAPLGHDPELIVITLIARLFIELTLGAYQRILIYRIECPPGKCEKCTAPCWLLLLSHKDTSIWKDS